MTTQDKLQMQKRLNRARLLEFEKEIESRLDSLNEIESEMRILSEQRRAWLENISMNHSSDSDIYLQRVELVKAQAEQLSLTLKLDVLKLESQYETMRLAKLVEFTRPLAENEHEDDRIEALKLQARKDNDSLRLLLQHSLDHRLEIAHLASDLLQHLSRLQHQSELEQQDKAASLSTHLQEYCENMRESTSKARLLYGDIVREYLILRHNAQVAKEILCRNQNDAMFARQELQLKLQKLTKDAHSKRRKHETAAAHELKVKLSELRGEVMRKEKRLEELKIEVRELKSLKTGEVQETLLRIQQTKKRFLKLQQARRETTLRMTNEVDSLRHAVHSLTTRQLALSDSAILDCLDQGQEEDEALVSSQLLRTEVKRMLQRLALQHKHFHAHQYPSMKHSELDGQSMNNKKKKKKTNKLECSKLRFQDEEQAQIAVDT